MGDKTFYAKWNHASDATTITTITKATPGKDGTIVKTCCGCGETLSTTVIPKVSGIKLSATGYTYNGKTRTPKVKVVDAKGKRISSDDYIVSCTGGRRNVGSYKVSVTLKGNYEGRSSRRRWQHLGSQDIRSDTAHHRR